jgi:hypothetical protein
MVAGDAGPIGSGDGRIEELEAMAHRVAAMRRADRRKGAQGGYQAIGHLLAPHQ